MSDLVDRGKCLLEILSLTIRKELRDSYLLNLGEMYTLLDYSSDLESRLAAAEAERDELQGEANDLSDDYLDMANQRNALLDKVNYLEVGSTNLLALHKAVLAERDTAWLELKNFLAAFDTHWACYGSGDSGKYQDSKQAMFSAAIQARACLTRLAEPSVGIEGEG